MPSIGRFRYLEAVAQGARPRGTLVLLHAFPLNARMWEPQLPLNQHGWRVIVPELRGFGEGAADPPTTSIDDYAGDVIDLLDALHVHDVVLCGLSLGGYVAFALFRHVPSRIKGLVLADTRPQADTPEGVEGRRRMLTLLGEKGPRAIADEMLPKLLGATTRERRPDVTDLVRTLILSNASGAIAGALRALMTRPDSTALLPTIHCPTLILVGEEDAVTPPPLSQEMHRAIGGAEIAVLPGAGHLSSLEQPDAFNAALARFLTHRV